MAYPSLAAGPFAAGPPVSHFSGYRGSPAYVPYGGPTYGGYRGAYRFSPNPYHPRFGSTGYRSHYPFLGYDPYYTPNLLLPKATPPRSSSITGESDFWYPEDLPFDMRAPNNDNNANQPPRQQPLRERKPAAARAHVQVKVPAKARLWFNGKKTVSRGRRRRFHTPPLEPGRKYDYTLRARWKMNGKTVTQTQKVRVRAGAEVDVAFPVASNPQDHKRDRPNKGQDPQM
jgi:uncharacterized protein (TIGR03000 family)